MKSFPSLSWRVVPATCLLAGLTASVANAQYGQPAVLYTFDGSQPGERLGWSLAAPGDLNGDGVPDILAGGPGDFISGSFPGIVRAYSGLDGSVLYTVSGQQGADGFGLAIAALPDLDNDGHPDFAVGAPYDDATGADSGSVYVFSGATGALVHKINGGAAGDAFGWSICDGRDFNSDGLPDLVVGAPLADSPLPDSGTAYLFDPASAAQLDSRDGGSALAEFGYSVASAVHSSGSVDDKFLFVGAPGIPSAGGGSGRVLLWEPAGSPTPFLVAGAGQSTGLALSGFSVGVATKAAWIAIAVRLGSTQALVRLFSEAPGAGGYSEIGQFGGSPSVSLSACMDDPTTTELLIGDAIGQPFSFGSHWVDCNGAGWVATQGDLHWQGVGLTRAWAVAGLRFVNADSVQDFAVGDPTASTVGQDAGRVVVFVALDVYQPPATYCTAKTNSQGCAPAIGFQGAPSMSVGDNFHVTAANVLNNKPGLLLWSLNQNAIPFGGGTLCLGPLFHRTGVQFSGGNPPPNDCSGAYSFHFSQAYMTAKALTPGVTVYCQYYSRDDGFAAPGNIGLTDAVRFTVLP